MTARRQDDEPATAREARLCYVAYMDAVVEVYVAGVHREMLHQIAVSRYLRPYGLTGRAPWQEAGDA